jgi:hypothetical protein
MIEMRKNKKIKKINFELRLAATAVQNYFETASGPEKKVEPR